MTDNVNHTSIKLTRAVKTLFSLTSDAYREEFGDDNSHKRDFVRRVAEHYAGLIGCKVVDVGKLKQDIEATHRGPPNSVSVVVMFAIGIEEKPGSFGMTHGPTPSLAEMLDTEPGDNRSKIIRFEGDRRGNPKTEVVYSFETGVWQPVRRKPHLGIPVESPLAKQATNLAEQIIELSESGDFPSAGIGYAESVAGKARDILETVELENRATPGQVKALRNMLDGLERLFEHSDSDCDGFVGAWEHHK